MAAAIRWSRIWRAVAVSVVVIGAVGIIDWCRRPQERHQAMRNVFSEDQDLEYSYFEPEPVEMPRTIVLRAQSPEHVAVLEMVRGAWFEPLGDRVPPERRPDRDFSILTQTTHKGTIWVRVALNGRTWMVGADGATTYWMGPRLFVMLALLRPPSTRPGT